MDKLKTRILLISLLLVLLLSLQGVSAVTDDNGNPTTESIDLSICDNEGDVSSDKLSSAYESNNPDDVLSASNELDVLSVDEVPFTTLEYEISSTNENVELQHDYYTYQGSGSTISIYGDNRIIDGRGAVIDMEGSTIQAFYVGGSGITIKNLTIKNANYDGDGGAIYFSKSGTVENCNFIGNNATSNGGGVFFFMEGNVTNCNFVNNSAKNGGAIYFNGDINNVTVLGCFNGNAAERAGGAIYVKGKSVNNNFSSQFYGNNARQASGGAIFFYSFAENNIFESVFMNNYALYGGGIFFYKNANDNKFDSNFTSNIAKSCGGAIFFYNTTNNNNFTGYFTNNSALGQVDPTVGNGGAITFKDVSTNCIFTGEFINNTAALNGGGVNYRQTPHNITFNCNFINNNAPNGGGVNFFERFENVIFNGEFINNSAVNGGAIAAGAGSIKEVSFKRNHAENGGAVYFSNSSGTVENCNFSGNIATNGSAIYFESTSGTNTVSNSCLLNNRANSEALEVTTNNNNTTIAFTGQDNLLNAIYSNSDVIFTNVVYWSAEGIANTGSSAIKPSRSKNEAGQNITVCVAISGELVLNEVKVTDEDGKIVLDVCAGDDYFISVRHDADSYYTEAEKTIHKTFSVNVTSQTSTNKTVNITAKSNIPNEIIKGELQFILPDSSEITANYAGNGNWWALYAFADYGVYEVNASYTGLDKVAVNNANITVNKANSTLTVGDIVFDYDSTGSTSVSFTGATGVNASVIRQPNANVSVDGNMITVSGLNAGNYTLSVTTIADADHNNVTKTSKITVNKINSTLTVGDVVFDYGGAGSASVSFTGATGVNANVVNQPDAVVDVESNIITVSGLDAGNYTLSVTTIADANHNNLTRTADVTVKHVVFITIAPITGHAGEVIGFTAQFKYENGDAVNEGIAGLTIRYVDRHLLAASSDSISSADESVPVSDGKATFNVKLGVPGTYTYVVTYSSEYTDDAQAESTLTILKAVTTVSGVDISGKTGDEKDVTVTVSDQDNKSVENGTVTLTLNGKPYSANVENGKAVISVELPNPGEYNATVTYNGNDYYNSSSSSISVNVEKLNTKVPSASDVSGKAGEKTEIRVEFVDEKGNPVRNGTATPIIDGKTYTAEVNDGVATFKDVVLPSKDTVADVYYQGNDYYNASSATFSIKVKQNNTGPDSNNMVEKKTAKHASTKAVDGNATGNPMAMMLLALFALVITYRKKIKL